MTLHLRPLAAATRLATAVARRTRRRKCPLCRATVPRDVAYCPSHHRLEIGQYEESRR